MQPGPNSRQLLRSNLSLPKSNKKLLKGCMTPTWATENLTTGTKIGPTTLDDQASTTTPRCTLSGDALMRHSNRNSLPYHPSQLHSQISSTKLETWIVPSACLHQGPIHPLQEEDAEEVVLPLEFKQLKKKNLPQK